MVDFSTVLVNDLRKMFTIKSLNIALHSIMLMLCLVGSVVFLVDVFDTETQRDSQQRALFGFWSLETFSLWFSRFVNFIKIKIIVPTFILSYFYFCIKQKVFQKLLKNDYTRIYNEKYTKIHKVSLVEDKKSKRDVSIAPQQSSDSQESFSGTRKGMFDQGGDSSLNISQDMVRSMSKSMVGSIKSIGNPNLSQSMIDKGNLSIRSSKVIQNVSKKMIEGCNGKDLNSLFDKNKNMSESFMSMSSSGIEGEDTTKIRIKNKKYYDFINDKQSQQFKKWYDEANSKYIQQLKASKQDTRSYFVELMQLKRGLEKEFSCFLKEYKENTEAIKECLVRFWGVKIEAYESKKALNTAFELLNVFSSSQKDDKNALPLTRRQDSRDVLVNQKLLFKRCSSPKDFIKHLNYLKLNLRVSKQKDFAQKQLIQLLSKRSFMNTLLNISSIQGDLFSQSQTTKIKSIEKILSTLTSNKIDFFTFSRNENQGMEMDLLEEYDIETIKGMIELRQMMLTYLVNKVNLMCDEKHFKVKMKLAVTYDSGFLNTAMGFFNNKNFAEIQCNKTFDNVFSHFNVKVFKCQQGQEISKESIIYTKPGIDNSISALYFLVKEISEYLNENYRFDERLTFEDKKREESFRHFIDSLHTSRKI